MTLNDVLFKERKSKVIDGFLDYVPIFGYSRVLVDGRLLPNTFNFWYQSACIAAYGSLTTFLL